MYQRTRGNEIIRKHVSCTKILLSSWLGHVKSVRKGNVTKRFFGDNLNGERPRGRPKQQLVDCVASDQKLNK